MKKIISMLLSVFMMICLCSCGAPDAAPSVPNLPSPEFSGELLDNSTAAVQETPTEQPSDAPVSPVPSEPPSPTATAAVPATATPDSTLILGTHEQPVEQLYSDLAQISMSLLRGDIDASGAVFGVAYIGSYFSGGMSYSEWFSSAAETLIEEYPFISEIDAAHTIGTTGHLYCILAKDYSTAITAQTLNGEVLYKANDGDPILIFCSRDGDGMTADTVITFSTEAGAVYQWSPRLDGMNFPELLIGAERQLLSWDFTPTPDAGFDLNAWLIDGWLGPTASGLTGEGGSSWWINTWDHSRNYCLSFSPDGEATLECFYGKDITVQARWRGGWRIEPVMDSASQLYLDLTLEDGADTAAYGYAAYISESYQALVPLSGNSLLLVHESGTALLPVFPDGALAAELTLNTGWFTQQVLGY